MRFTKMEGAGNDYVYIDAFAETLPDDLSALARAMADRHFGVGGDGMVLIGPSDQADARMRMFNADGSESQMCGNAIRCVAKYLYEHGLCVKDQMQIETGFGVLPLELFPSDGVVDSVRVGMGRPVLAGSEIPTTFPGAQVVDVPLAVAGRDLTVTCVSMGNPHCVTFVEELSDEWVLGVGPEIEVDPHFPERVNAEFVQVVSPTEVRMRVWERGTGETMACGTGAAAVCVAGVLTGRTERQVAVQLPGGTLHMDWEPNGPVYMTGPAREVFSGDWPAGQAARSPA